MECAARAGLRREGRGGVLSPAKAAKSHTHRTTQVGPSRRTQAMATTPLAPRAPTQQADHTAPPPPPPVDVSEGGKGEEAENQLAPKTPAAAKPAAAEGASFVTPGRATAAGDDAPHAPPGAIHPIVEGRIVRVGQ